jgi:secreted trypsin-like serine protease
MKIPNCLTLLIVLVLYCGMTSLTMATVTTTGAFRSTSVDENTSISNENKIDDRMLTGRIVGGNTVSFGDYPSFVYVSSNNGSNNGTSIGYGSGGVGGTLIHPDAILTSASTKGYFIGQNVSIGGGIMENGTDSVETITVIREVSHKSFNFPMNNIMIVFLQQPSTIGIVQKLNWNTIQPKLNSTVSVIGYGSVSYNSTSQEEEEQSLTLQLVSYNVKKCNAYNDNFNRPKQFICAGTTSSTVDANTIINTTTTINKGVCIGDDGSPLFATTGQGQGQVVKQVGIANFKKVNDCGSTFTVPDGYTRVSYYKRWIRYTICMNTIVTPLPTYCTYKICNKNNDRKCHLKFKAP